jgi:hypothetical protein
MKGAISDLRYSFIFVARVPLLFAFLGASATAAERGRRPRLGKLRTRSLRFGGTTDMVGDGSTREPSLVGRGDGEDRELHQKEAPSDCSKSALWPARQSGVSDRSPEIRR